MPDLNFFHRQGPFTLGQIATTCEATLLDSAHETIEITDVSPLNAAGTTDLSFIDNRKYNDQFLVTRAGACIMRPDLKDMAPAGVAALLSANPYKSYALAAQLFYPAVMPEPGISDRAAIDVTAELGAGCRVDSFAVIGAHVSIGDGCWIEAGAIIGDGVQIGPKCRIGTQASVSHAILGTHVRLYPGARVGQDGFGFAIDPKGFVKVPQLGRVIIEDHVEVGANTCIDRGAGPDTIIGMGTWIDNLVQIGHNVKIGRGCILVSQVGISGSTEIEDFVAIGGQVGIAGHLHIGKGAQLAAKSGVINDIEPGITVMGYPALPKTQFMRHVAYLNKMTRKGKIA